MIPECVNCKKLFTCTIKDKPRGEACVIFEKRSKDEEDVKKRFEEVNTEFSK